MSGYLHTENISAVLYPAHDVSLMLILEALATSELLADVQARTEH